jgi:hypothetical protein
MTPEIFFTARELNTRVTDGLHVTLLWSETTGEVAVSVDDRKTGDSFVVEVREGERAMDVFHHPYAYAARTGHSRAGSAAARSQADRPVSS